MSSTAVKKGDPRERRTVAETAIRVGTKKSDVRLPSGVPKSASGLQRRDQGVPKHHTIHLGDDGPKPKGTAQAAYAKGIFGAGVSDEPYPTEPAEPFLTVMEAERHYEITGRLLAIFGLCTAFTLVTIGYFIGRLL